MEIGGTPEWVWKAFTRGYYPLFMDPYDASVWSPATTDWVPMRQALRQTARLATHVDLRLATPSTSLASTGYCLAAPGAYYIVWSPSGTFTVDLAAEKGAFTTEWVNPVHGEPVTTALTQGGAIRTLTPPFDGPVVLFLRKASGEPPAPPVKPTSWTFTLKQDRKTLSLQGPDGAELWRASLS